MKMKKPAKANPFEVHINKQKMTVLGQKNKNDRGLPGVSRAKALKKRKKTLLQEFKQQHKSNQFNDRRIGERNNSLSGEDKIIARFAAIRKKAHKKSIYNLADDEVLTHKGQTLAELEKFDDPRSEDEYSDDGRTGNLESNFVEDAHFGGGILKNTGKDGARTHKELIDELIAESKKRKAEKQKTKEATLELTEKLDTEWKDLLPLVNTNRKDDQQGGQMDDYDKIMRELRFEPRGTVSDKLKSENQIAEEEKEKLVEMERERLERMRGFEENNKRNHRSADDLDDDLVYESDPEYMLSYNKEGESNVEVTAEIDGRQIGEEAEEENESSESESEADELSDLKAEESEEEEEETDTRISDHKAEESEEETDTTTIPTIQEDDVMEQARNELPYTFEIPESYEDLQKVFENQSIAHQNVIVERIIKCNHPSLSEKNKEKLKLFFIYLLQYLNDCACEFRVQKTYEIFAVLAPHIFDLTQLDKVHALNSIKEVLKEKRDSFKQSPKKLPGFEVLFFLKLVSVLYPTSDFRHQVVTPSFVFMEQILFRCKFRTRKEISFGVFLLTLILEYTVLSKRYAPSAINCLGGLLHMALPKSGVKLIKVKPPFQATSNFLVLLNKFEEIEDLKMQADDLEEDKIDDEFKVRVLYNILKLIQEFEANLSGLASSPEIFKDILEFLELLPMQNYPTSVSDQYRDTLAQLKTSKNNRSLNYIVLEALKPKALRLYEPKFEPVFDYKKRKVQSKEKSERDKLLHKLKKETKGAMREIRRDKAFLGRFKIHNRIQSDNERKDKVKRIFAEAASQQSELNAIDRKKKRK